MLLKACLNGGTTRGAHPSVPQAPAELAAERAARCLGPDIRVGLEDTVVLEDGRLASGNRELVQAAARMADKV